MMATMKQWCGHTRIAKRTAHLLDGRIVQEKSSGKRSPARLPVRRRAGAKGASSMNEKAVAFPLAANVDRPIASYGRRRINSRPGLKTPLQRAVGIECVEVKIIGSNVNSAITSDRR
jgi:hypothetical protein